MSGFVQKLKVPLLAAAVATALICSGFSVPVTADSDIPPGGFPSWQDVENARRNEGSKAVEVSRINGLLGGLQAEAEKRGTAAVAAAADYAEADAAQASATAKVDALAEQTGRADNELARYRKQTGALAAQAYKGGSGSSGLGYFAVLEDLESDGLQGLSVLHLVEERTAELVNNSLAAEKTARSLKDQAMAARAERERLAGEAKVKFDAAQTARRAMDEQISLEQQHNQELTAQLASLKGTTAEVEGQYREGQAALAAYATAQAAKQAAAAERARQQGEEAAKSKNPPANPGAPTTTISPEQPVYVPPPAVVPPSNPGGVVNDPAGAQSYASARLGTYGWGQDQFQCLVWLWNRESNWLTTATNPSSGAYGIAQALPAGKYASAGSDWLNNYRTQVDWGLGYIRDRYGSPCGAWAHSQAVGWY